MSSGLVPVAPMPEEGPIVRGRGLAESVLVGDIAVPEALLRHDIDVPFAGVPTISDRVDDAHVDLGRLVAGVASCDSLAVVRAYLSAR